MARAILKNVLGTLVTSVAVIGTTAQGSVAQVGFTGDFAPEQWILFNSSPAFPDIDNSQLTINGIPLAPFNGSVDFTGAPDSLTLLGSDQSAILAEFGLSCESPDLPAAALFLCDDSFTTVFVTVPEESNFSFDWNYTTTDAFGPAFDPFGYVVSNFPPDDPQADGRFIELIDRAGPSNQSGTFMLPNPVGANQVLGFQIGTADNRGGRASVTISNFQVMMSEPDGVDPKAVPEPASAIAIAAFAGLALRLSKRSQ